MNNTTNNNVTGNNKPRLKKVKKPIRKIQPQMPQNADSKPIKPTKPSQAVGNPFQQQSSANRIDPFEVDITGSNQLTPVRNVPDANGYKPQFITDEQEYGVNYNEQNSLSEKKKLIIASIIAFVVGFIFAMMMGGEQTVTHNGLQGVVVNAEVPPGRARCGNAPAGQGCVLYIMNPQRQELNARDFYDLASQLTGRQRFVIETGNMRYSNMKIRPGEIGQFNIPPMTQ